ncbi:MAG: guanyl-specific ribonuclease Sa [Myxococcota bacterium]|jgi:guanyl-specific ribonuclease Sa
MRTWIRIAVVLAVLIVAGARLWSGETDEAKTSTAPVEAPTPTIPFEAPAGPFEAPKTDAKAVPAPKKQPEAKKQSESKKQGPAQRILDDVTVKNYGRVVHRGPMDLGPSIDRILKGKRHPHRNDGAVFRNREKRLPSKPRAYYREYVHPTKDVRGPGPQRLLVGSGAEWYYTPDHYETFVRLEN